MTEDVICSGCGAELSDPWDTHDGAGFSLTGAVSCPLCKTETWYEREVRVTFRQCAEPEPGKYRDVRVGHVVQIETPLDSTPGKGGPG